MIRCRPGGSPSTRAPRDWHKPPAAPASASAKPKASWFKLLGYRQTWAFAFGKFMTDGVWWFFLFWLPKYMSAQYGLSGPDMVVPLAVLTAFAVVLVGSAAAVLRRLLLSGA